jgi:uncharacterized protein (DUF2336 family)
MKFERFLQWIAAAPSQARADAARALVAAYSHVGRDPQRTERLDRMVAILLDDPSIVVRRALAEAAARSVDVPRCVVVALASDDVAVAILVLAASPLLSDVDLVEAVAIGDVEAQLVIAERVGLSAILSTALVEAGLRDVVLALVRNSTAVIPAAVLRRILHVFCEDAEIREALLDHSHGDPALHHDLVLASTEALTRFAIACDWMSPSRAESLRRDSHDKGVVTIAARCRETIGAAGPRALVTHLRTQGRLTPALLLRALLSGNRDLCEAAFAHLSSVLPGRVEGHMRAPASLGFASLYAKAGLPPSLLPVFRAALAAMPAAGSGHPSLSRDAIRDVLQTCLRTEAPELSRVTALLRRLEAEALRDAVRPRLVEEDEPMRHPAAPDLTTFRAAQPMPQLTLRAA